MVWTYGAECIDRRQNCVMERLTLHGLKTDSLYESIQESRVFFTLPVILGWLLHYPWTVVASNLGRVKTEKEYPNIQTLKGARKQWNPSCHAEHLLQMTPPCSLHRKLAFGLLYSLLDLDLGVDFRTCTQMGKQMVAIDAVLYCKTPTCKFFILHIHLVYQCIYVYPQSAAGHAVFWDSVCPEEEDDHFRQWKRWRSSHLYSLIEFAFIYHYICILYVYIIMVLIRTFYRFGLGLPFAMLCLWSMVTGLHATGGAWCAYPERACSQWCLRASSLALKQSLHGWNLNQSSKSKVTRPCVTHVAPISSTQWWCK